MSLLTLYFPDPWASNNNSPPATAILVMNLRKVTCSVSGGSFQKEYTISVNGNQYNKHKVAPTRAKYPIIMSTDPSTSPKMAILNQILGQNVTP